MGEALEVMVALEVEAVLVAGVAHREVVEAQEAAVVQAVVVQEVVVAVALP
jgi:hypothetical protein